MGRPQFESPTDIKAQSLNEVTAKINTNVANQLDEDLVSEDLSAGDYTVKEQSISGAQELTIGMTENSANNASATIHWTDGNGNTLFKETPADLTDLNNAGEWANLIVKSTHVKVVFSGASTDLDATVNAHG